MRLSATGSVDQSQGGAAPTATVIHIGEAAAPHETNWWVPLVPYASGLIALIVLALIFKRSVRAMIDGLTLRLKRGATVKLGAFELGGIGAAQPADATKNASALYSGEAPAGIKEAHVAEQTRVRKMMLVHRLFRASDAEGIYEVIVFLVPRFDGSLIEVKRVGYFFGQNWNSLQYFSVDRTRGFAVRTRTALPLFCQADIEFNDGTTQRVFRDIDLEMADLAPLIESKLSITR